MALRSPDVQYTIKGSAGGKSSRSLSNDPAVVATVWSVWPEVQRILGDPALQPPPTAQIAVQGVDENARPLDFDEVPDSWRLHAVDNGNSPGTLNNYTVLVAVAITDVPAPNWGNFAVVPFSHRVLATRLQAPP